MSFFSFHLAEAGLANVGRALLRPPTSDGTPGLRHAECMTLMQLGTPILSPARARPGHLAVFAAWEHESALERFLSDVPLGRVLDRGWHVRMEFLRRWGHVAAFDGLPEDVGESDPGAPVVAVTLARLRLLQVPRFIRWGKPVETLVRDHPGVTLAQAAMRPPNTISTFTVWRTQREMSAMVHGGSAVPEPDRHAVAMVERDRKDFHHEFTTLRFRALSEHGEWDGRSDVVPGAGSSHVLSSSNMQPPTKLDGAVVLRWAWSGSEPFFVMPDGGEGIPIHGLAVCRYEDSGSIYRFSCSRSWEVENDSPYDTVDRALQAQSGSFDVSSVAWH